MMPGQSIDRACGSYMDHLKVAGKTKLLATNHPVSEPERTRTLIFEGSANCTKAASERPGNRDPFPCLVEASYGRVGVAGGGVPGGGLPGEDCSMPN